MSTVGTQELTRKSPPTFTTATIGKKILMAISGVIVIGFLIIHLLGNLQLFIGPEALNKYANTLQSLGAIKWSFRAFLLLFFLIHVWKGLVLWLENRSARPVSYAKTTSQKTTLASKTMPYTGIMIFLFVILHLWHFTISPEHPAGELDVYSTVVAGFQDPIYSTIYLVALFLMAFHLSHATSSFFQTLGLNKATVEPKLKVFANLFAAVIFLAYASMPVAVLTGFIGGGH